jgi:hypothetical protein
MSEAVKLRILLVGLGKGTSAHRANALRSLGHDVTHVPSDPPEDFLRRQLYRVGHRLRRDPDLVGTNRRIAETLARSRFDLLWVDKGITIAPSTLRRAKHRNPDLIAVSYSPDDMFASDLQSTRYLACVPVYDLHVTTKSFNVDDLPHLGARDVLFVDNAYEPDVHRPLELNGEDARRFTTQVGFAGTFETQRAETMLALARDGVAIKVWGHGWNRMRTRHPNLELASGQLSALEYTKAINATDINLGFLRKAYRDVQTTRSIEIPACGAFMLAERSEEHSRLFVEGEEAEFFGSYRELLEKIRYYLAHPDERARIAAAGRKRCLTGGYDNRTRLAGVLDEIKRRHPTAFESRE